MIAFACAALIVLLWLIALGLCRDAAQGDGREHGERGRW